MRDSMSSILIRRANMVSGGNSPRLPAGYTELAYIESSGTQWIDSGIKDVVNFKAEIDFQVTQLASSSAPTIVGAAEASSKYKVVLAYSTSSNIFYSQCGGSGLSTRLIASDTSRHFVVVTNTSDSQNIQVDGATYTSSYAITNTKTVSLALFARKQTSGSANNYVSMKLWSAKLYSSGNLVKDLVPAMRDSDSVVGMYDLVSDTFLTNAGTGTFNYGIL